MAVPATCPEAGLIANSHSSMVNSQSLIPAENVQFLVNIPADYVQLLLNIPADCV